jgi:hypothetical protein
MNGVELSFRRLIYTTDAPLECADLSALLVGGGLTPPK